MKRVLILPNLLAGPGEVSVLSAGFSSLRRAEELGKLTRVTGAGNEAAFFTLEDVEIAPGVLAVSALEADPPERSTHFQTNLLSLQGDQLRLVEPRSDELGEIVRLLPKLDRKVLTGLAPRRPEDPFALVFEDWAELRTTSPDEVEEKPLSESLPDGDADEVLRRYIDDSINLLSEQEFNRRREGEGDPMVNVLWPWGAGFRPSLPNLTLRYGSLMVQGRGHRWRGLARLVRWRGETLPMRDRLEPDWGAILAGSATFLVVQAPANPEEAEWFLARLDERLLAPLLVPSGEGIEDLMIVATAVDGRGLALELPERFSTGAPLREETLEDGALPQESLARLIAGFLSR